MVSLVGGANVWSVSAAERAKHDEQFFSLKPVGGFVTGEQARGFFMQSGLPSAVLAQIWALADLNADGKMDRREFSIAMHLIQKKLQGFDMPAVLPDTIKSDPTPAVGTFGPGGAMPGGFSSSYPMMPAAGTLPPQQHGMGMSYQPPPPQMPGYGTLPATAPVSASLPASPLHRAATGDWAMPPQSRQRYAQMFGALDRGRVGALSGVEARGVLCQHGLNNHVLAQIWTLSDLDKDGRLTCDEFCIAMHLIELAKMGYQMPATTPAVLLPGGAPGLATAHSPAPPNYSAAAEMDENAARSPMFKSFEDRRRDNFDKGQAELGRRRQILREQEERERAERERKDREERDRREREVLEAERRRQLEMEKQLARQREFELHQQEEQRKMLEQREAARRELERQRQQEIERGRVRELTAARQAAQEAVCHVKQREKNLGFQLQALGEKATEMNEQITRMREQIVQVTGDIEGMKHSRDSKLAEIEQLKVDIHQTQMRSQAVAREKHSLVAESRNSPASTTSSVAATVSQVLHSYRNKQESVDKLRQELHAVEADLQQKRAFADDRRGQVTQLKATLANEANENRALHDKLAARQREFRRLVDSHKAATPNGAHASPTPIVYNGPTSGGGGGGGAWGASPAAPIANETFSSDFASWNGNATEVAAPAAAAAAAAGAEETQPYKALYEFAARSDDELSFQPGDVIQVLTQHNSEPGWLAGQFRGRVGWFPAAFAQPMDADAPAADAAQPPTPAVQKLPSIHEEPHEADATPRSVQAAQSAAAAVPTSNGDIPSAGAAAGADAIAQYSYKAKKDSHLSFQKGDRVTILEQDELLWRGSIDGRSGWFPKSYVRLCEAAVPDASAVSRDSIIVSMDPPQVYSDSEGEWFVSVYPFAAPETGDLAFDAGERIRVVSQEGDWWTGVVGERQGIFPATYVQPEDAAAGEPAPGPTEQPEGERPGSATSAELSEIGKAIAPFSASAANQLTLAPGDLVRVCSKSPTGWWEGELQKFGQERRKGWFPANYVKLLGGGAPDDASPAPAAGAAAAEGEAVEALFDYLAQRDDELSFSRGDAITVVDKKDKDWWEGVLADGARGLFPSNYVQPVADARWATPRQSPSPSSTSTTAEDRKRARHAQELIDTEKNYIDDLVLVREVFRRPLEADGHLAPDEVSVLFANWDQLISVGRAFHRALRASEAIGAVVLQQARPLEAFARFCERQQAAIELLAAKEAASTAFRAAYHACCQHPSARGLPLGYFLLLPMTRVTKYPLLLESILKYTDPPHADYPDLVKAVQMLKELCAEVNRVVTEVENLYMHHWCQNHVRCDELRPKLVFHSATNACGPRKFVHSGILYKAKSNRLLVGLLFNDFLMLNEPVEHIDQADSFKLTRTTDLQLTMYRQPILLYRANLQLTPSLTGATEEDAASTFVVAYGEETVALRAVNPNARTLWTRRLEQTIRACRQATDRLNSAAGAPVGRGIGRLMIELVCVRQLSLPAELGQPPAVVCRLRVAEQLQTKALDLARKDSLCSTQFVLGANDARLCLTLHVRRPFAPDLCVGGVDLPVAELIRSSGSHRGPILRQLSLANSQLKTDEKSFVIVKFFLQMFDS